MLITDVTRRGRSFASAKKKRGHSFSIAGYLRFLPVRGGTFFKSAIASLLLLSLSGNIVSLVWAPGDRTFGTEVAASTDEERQELETKLKEVESQITVYEGNIRETQAQGKTLKDQIGNLDRRINKLNLQIRATDLQIRRLNLQIDDTNESIRQSQLQMAQAKELLERSIRAVEERDRQSLLEILLANAALSDFFDEVNAQTAIQIEAQNNLEAVRSLRETLEAEREKLTDEKEDQTNLSLIQESQKREIAADRREKNQLLALTQGKESLYQQLLRESQKTAAEIRAQLYRLLGGGEIQFGDAVRYAEFAASQTGVRPALLLAVLAKESDLGKNVGRCSWKTAMHPTRDQPAFLQITAELKLDPDTMLVSCPIRQDGAYGGAMGFAQFLPSTWLLYKDRISAIVGRTPSPWNPQDAFMASALYLADAGATAKTFAAERQAAAKYYAGRRWRYYLWSYGDRVMRLAADYQNQLDILRRANVPLSLLSP